MNAILNPPDQQDAFTDQLREMGYDAAKRLPDGSYATLTRLMTTLAICLGVDGTGWSRRFCFKDTTTCLAEWQQLQSSDAVPIGWIARRPELPNED